MRNLKRALSLALASVMLLGMMVVGSSAAFADEADIVNKEAVTIINGLKIMEGKGENKFDPTGTVTRAEMATVIVKMLYGSEINADQFKGTGKFSDVSGWAEGYINLCANLGIVNGYGDGTFQPEKKLNTAEALTMIINALGADAGEGTWPMTVMAKAEEMEIFKNIEGAKPTTYAELSRDQLAVAVWAGLNWSEEGVKGYQLGNKKFDTMADAIAYAKSDDETVFVDMDGVLVPTTDKGTLLVTDIVEVKEDTLAKDVFEISKHKGWITANQATGEKSTWINDAEDYNINTGLDQYGHYVTIYFSEKYENEKKPGTAYAVVEMAEYVTVSKAITKKADYIAAFGAKVEDAIGVYGYDKDAYTAGVGTYVISTDELNNEGKIIGFIPNATTYVAEVTAVSETAGKEYIKLGTKRYNNNADEDVIVAYDGIAEDDIVVYKEYTDGQDNTMTYVYKPEVVSGKITKTKDASGDYANRIWVDGTEYEMSSADASALLDVYADIDLENNSENTYDVYLYNGKVLGVKITEGAADIGEVIYVTNNYSDDVKGVYGNDGTKTYYYAQGVDAKGEEVSILIGVEGTGVHTDECEDECEIDHIVTTLDTNAFYTFKKSTVKEQAKKDVMVATEVVDVDDFDVDEDDYFAAAVTFVGADGDKFEKTSKYVTVTKGEGTARVYLNGNTKYFIVDNFDSNGVAGYEVDITVYTTAITKSIDGADVDVIATEDENGNKYAQLVVIYAESGLAAEDYIYVSDIATADASTVKGGYQLEAYFSETNEFKTIIADELANGFYTEWAVNEDGIYELEVFEGDEGVFEDQLLDGVVGEAIITTAEGDAMDLFGTAGVKIYDLRDPEDIKYSDVAEIATLKDLESILKDEKHVYFDAIVDVEVEGKEVVTHIFVYSVQYELLDCAEDTIEWVEDDGTTYTKAELCATLANAEEPGDYTCENCGLEFTVEAEEE